MQLEYQASAGVRSAIAAIGRTEDVHLSPGNDRLALAGLVENTVLVLEARLGVGEEVTVELHDHLKLRSDGFRYPHGLVWLDDESLAVANRKGEVVIVAVPRERPASRDVEAQPLLRLRADERDLLRGPGSIAAVERHPGLIELLVCSNYGHYVTRHVLDRRGGLRSAPGEILYREGLDIPDGVAISDDRRWAAVSNHNGHCVHLHAQADPPVPGCRPQGILRGVEYPHGLRFTGDGRFILVADAGAPFVHVFADESGDWSGERLPVLSIKVIDDDSFRRGRTNPAEGGPKGIAVDRLGAVLVASCEEQPLIFHDLRSYLRRAGVGFSPRGPATAEQLCALSEELAHVREEAQRSRMALEAARPRAEAAEHKLQTMQQSRSWKVTAPMRVLAEVLRRRRPAGAERRGG